MTKQRQQRQVVREVQAEVVKQTGWLSNSCGEEEEEEGEREREAGAG